jgi:CRP-like cAMP-binding protein
MGVPVTSPLTRKALAATQLFSTLPDAALDSIASQGMERTYKKGQVLIHATDPGDALYVIVEGAVKVYVISEDGDELIVGIPEAPVVLGEVAVGDGGPRSATIEAVRTARVLVITRPQFLTALGENPELVESYISMLVGLIRRLQGRTEDLVFLDLQGRVAKLLLTLLEERSEDGTALDLNMTQGELAAMVGGSRPSVNQVLKALEGRGFIDLEGKQIVIKDSAALQRLAGV